MPNIKKQSPQKTFLCQQTVLAMHNPVLSLDTFRIAIDALRLHLVKDVTVVVTFTRIENDNTIVSREYTAKMAIDANNKLILYGTNSAADDASDIEEVCDVSDDIEDMRDELDYQIDSTEVYKAFDYDEFADDLFTNGDYVELFFEKRIRFF